MWAVFRIRVFFLSDPDRIFIPEYGSGSAENQDPIKKILILIHEKTS